MAMFLEQSDQQHETEQEIGLLTFEQWPQQLVRYSEYSKITWAWTSCGTAVKEAAEVVDKLLTWVPMVLLEDRVPLFPLCRAVAKGEWCDDIVTTDEVEIVLLIPDPTTDWRLPSTGVEELFTCADGTRD